MQLRDLIGRLGVIGGERETARLARRLALQAGALFRGPVETARAELAGIAALAADVEAEAASWREPEEIRAGASGPFDACDLRVWLLLAERAGVPFVPARQILTLTEAELEAVDRRVEAPAHVAASLRRGLARVAPEAASGPGPAPGPDREAVAERLFEAMSDVPADWMVRSHLAGSSTLKALAGTGLLEDGRDGARLSEEIEVGAGWVRVGNRTRIDATDRRFVETFARGHKDRLHFLARPWMTPGRWAEGEDPHRHGSPFAGKGRWPMEWRVFVEGGRVTGVAAYYAWVGSVTPENTARALEAARLAQVIVDAGLALRLAPRLMDVEILRRGASAAALRQPHIREALERFPSDGFACTLDFLETADGMMLLEGGPAHTPIGGGHPCAFAGFETSPTGGCRTEGVALRLIEGALLAEPATWRGRRNDGAVLGWDEAAALAAREDDPAP